MAKATKKPLQVYLRPDQLNALRALAEKRGDSMARLVREGVDKVLQEVPTEEDPLLEVVGLYDSGAGDLSERHDEFLAQMIEEENQDEG